ncbi:MAG TPA: hypothetical protein PL045_03695 [Chitinophagaceae bacterium]|nr:hypothetical protein [Chitinophagaceae bacterium]
MENYTLNRFYHEAKALLEKYNAVKEEFRLSVGFDIKESNRQFPILQCEICYDNGKGNYEYLIFSSTPEACLNVFEKELIIATGTVLKEKVSADFETTENIES